MKTIIILFCAITSAHGQYMSYTEVLNSVFDSENEYLRASTTAVSSDINDSRSGRYLSAEEIFNLVFDDELEAMRFGEYSATLADANDSRSSRWLSMAEVLNRCYDTTYNALRMVNIGGSEVSTRYYLELDTLDFDTISAIRNVTQVFALPERHEIALFAAEIFESGGEDFDLATNDDSANVAFVAGASGAGVGSSRLEFAALDTLDVYITKHGATSADSFVVAFVTFDADDLGGGTHEAVAFDTTYGLSIDTLTTASSIVATLPELTDVHSLVVAIDTATSAADTVIVELGGREIARFETEAETTMTIATPNAFTFASAGLTVRLTSVNTGHIRIRARGVCYEN